MYRKYMQVNRNGKQWQVKMWGMEPSYVLSWRWSRPGTLAFRDQLVPAFLPLPVPETSGAKALTLQLGDKYTNSLRLCELSMMMAMLCKMRWAWEGLGVVRMRNGMMVVGGDDWRTRGVLVAHKVTAEEYQRTQSWDKLDYISTYLYMYMKN